MYIMDRGAFMEWYIALPLALIAVLGSVVVSTLSNKFIFSQNDKPAPPNDSMR
jgi:hypothetical protein